MLNVDGNTNQVIQRTTLLLESREAIELIEKLSYLLNHPDYHHDHMDDGKSVIDISIIYPDTVHTYHHDLKPLLEQYFAQKESGKTAG